MNNRVSIKEINLVLEKRRKQVRASLVDSERQITRGYDAHRSPNSNSRSNKVAKKTLYDTYKEKEVDRYNSRDVLYYYKDLCKKHGIKFVSNLNTDKRYMRNIKQVMENYSQEDICNMYDFLFESGQTYLDPRKLNPAILLTQWVNTIYADTQDWLEGSYASNKKVKDREFKGEKICTVDDWGDM